MKRRTGSNWTLALVAGGLLAAAYYVLPAPRLVQATAILGATIVTTTLLLVRLRRERLLHTGPWVFLAAGMVAYSVASLFWALWQQLIAPLPFPTPVDVAFFVSYALWAAFFLVVIYRVEGDVRDARRQATLGLVDAAIFTCAALSVLWPTMVTPSITERDVTGLAVAAAIAYPALLSFLFGFALHLAVSGLARNVAGVMVIVWIAGELAGDIYYGFLSLKGHSVLGHPSSLGWFVSYTALAALSLHPNLRQLGQGATRQRTRRVSLRIALLLIGPATPLGVAVVVVDPDRLFAQHPTAWGLGALMVAALVLVVVRLQLVSGDLAEERRLARRLEEAVSRLEAQRDELTRLAVIVEATDDSVVTLSREGKIVGWNPGAARLYGYAPEEVVGAHVAMLVAPEHRSQMGPRFVALAERTHLTFDSVHVRKDRSRFAISVTVSNIYDDSGNVTAMVGIGRDITERRRAEAEAAQAAHDLASQAETLMARNRQQAAVVELGRRALAGAQLDELVDLATAFVADALGVERAGALDLLAGGDARPIAAGVGRGNGYAAKSTAGRNREPQVEHTFASSAFFLKDLSRQTPAPAPPLVVNDGRGGTTVDVTAAERRYGPREADVRERRLDDDDVNFLRAVANVLAEAAKRIHVEHELRRLSEDERVLRREIETYSRLVIHAQEAERRRIAFELHDEIGQTLTGLKLMLERQRGRDAEEAEGRRAAMQLVAELVTRVHDLSLDLRPAVLDDLGLLPALLVLFERYSEQTGVQVRFAQSGLERRVAPGVETAAYRIVQEALTNVARHARSGRADIECTLGDGVLRVEVSDEGRGFSPGSVRRERTSGLAGMRERARAVGGSVTIYSAPGAGTRVVAVLDAA